MPAASAGVAYTMPVTYTAAPAEGAVTYVQAPYPAASVQQMPTLTYAAASPPPQASSVSIARLPGASVSVSQAPQARMMQSSTQVMAPPAAPARFTVPPEIFQKLVSGASLSPEEMAQLTGQAPPTPSSAVPPSPVPGASVAAAPAAVGVGGVGSSISAAPGLAALPVVEPHALPPPGQEAVAQQTAAGPLAPAAPSGKGGVAEAAVAATSASGKAASKKKKDKKDKDSKSKPIKASKKKKEKSCC